MKNSTPLRLRWFPLLLSLAALGSFAWAEEKSDAPPPAPAAAPATETPAPPPAAPVAAETPAAPGGTDPKSAPTTSGTPAPVTPAEPALEKPASAPAPTPAAEEKIQWRNRDDIVQVFGSVTLEANERAGDVVVFGGNARINGEVTGDLVVFGGTVRLNGRVRGEVVTFGGNVELGPDSSIGGGLVVVGGNLRNPHGRPLPHHEVIGDGSFNLPDFENNAAVLWLQHGLFKGRLLVPSIAWPWMVFSVALLFYLLLAALFGRGVNACVQTIEERPAGTLLASFLYLFILPVLTLVLIATVIGGVLVPFLLLGVFFAGLFGKVALLTFLGRSVLRAFGLHDLAGQVVVSLLIGAMLMALFYLIPVVGVLLWMVSAWLGLGMALFTLMNRMRREKARANGTAATAPVPAPAAPTRRAMASSAGFSATAAAPVAPMSVAPTAADPIGGAEIPVVPAPGTAESPAPAPVMSAGFAGSTAAPTDVPPVLGGATIPPIPPVAPRGSYGSAASVNSMSPRADFWARLGALVIDIILVAVVGGITGLDGYFPLLFGLYSFGLWFWRGTTIGGVVFSLKIVRLDDRPVDPATVLVRVLVGYLSIIAAGLGFLWCAWDPEQQTWHDKVAGTIVVRAPKGMSLV